MFLEKKHYPTFHAEFIREPLMNVGTRLENAAHRDPYEPSMVDVQRFVGEGIRKKEAGTVLFTSAVPLLLAESAGDEGGTLVLVICCLITIYLFSVTGWGNEKIK